MGGDKGMKRAALLLAGGGRSEHKWVSDSLGMTGKSMKNRDLIQSSLIFGPSVDELNGDDANEQRRRARCAGGAAHADH